MEAQRATGRSAMKKCDLVKSKEFFGSRASFNEVNQPSHLTITVQYEEDDDFSIAVLRGNTTGIGLSPLILVLLSTIFNRFKFDGIN